MKRTYTSYIKYISGLLLFGFNGIVSSKIHLSSYEIVLFRTFMGSLFLALIFFITRKQKLDLKNTNKKELMYLILSGISMGGSWIFLYEAYVKIGVGLSSIAYYCGPVIVMLSSPFVFKEKIKLKQILCFATVFVGIILITISSCTDANIDMYGFFCGIISAVLHALMVIFTVKAPSITGNKNSMIQLIVGFLTILLLISFNLPIQFPSDGVQWFWMIFLGIVNTGLGCYLYFSDISKLSVQSVSILGYLEPLSAVVFSVILLSEGFTFWEVLGAILVLAGSVISEIKIKKNIK